MPEQILTYPKRLYSKARVINERNAMEYPKAWDFKEDKENFYLILNGNKFRQHYVVGKKPNAFQVGRNLGRTFMGR